MVDRLNAKYVEQILGLYHDYQYGIMDSDQVPRLHIFPEKERSVDIHKHIWPVDQPPHRVQAIEIQLVIDGSVSVNLNGKNITLEKNSLLILNPNVIRSLAWKEQEKGQVIHIYIDTRQFDQRFFTLVMDDNMFANYIYKSLYISNAYNDYVLVKDLSSGVTDVLFSLYDEYKNDIKPVQNNRVLYSWIAVLFLRLYDYCRDIEYNVGNDELETGYRKHLINGILNCIQESAKTATLASVSKAVHLHPNYICKVIKESTGKTFTEILNITKMRIATQMLESTDVSLEKIASGIGFSNPNYFYKVFKNYSGQTPGQYRKQRQNKSVCYLGSNEASESLHNAPQKDAERHSVEIAQTSAAILQFTPMNSDNPRIGFFPAASYKYIMEVGKGLSFSASKFGCMTRMYVPERDDVNEQVKLLTSALYDRLDVVVINAHDEYAIVPVLRRFIEKGTMVCLINRDDSQLSLDVHTVIGYRQRKATQKLGEYVVKKMRGLSARVGIIQGSTGYHSVERCGGFLDAIKNENNFEVVSIFNGNWSAQGGYEAAKQMLQSQPSINMIFCANDHEAVGVARAIEELGMRNIMLLGNDGDSDALQNILKGTMTATVGTTSYEMGSVAAQTIQRGLEGNIQNGFVETKTQIVDLSNAQIYLNLAQSYQNIIC